MGKGGKDGGKALLGIVGFAFGFGALGGGIQFGASTALMGGLYGASLASTLWSVFSPQEQENNATTSYSRFDSMMNQVSSEAMIPVVYGRRKWTGNQTWHSASSDGKGLTKDIVLCESPIHGISDIKANDLDIGSLPGCSYNFYDNVAPSNYGVVGSYKNTAWLRANLTVSQQLQGSNPTVSVIVKGTKVKVWDGNAWTKQYSENPAWCLLDYLTNRRYGLGRWVTWDMVDIESFKESAAYCDELITTKVPTTLATVDAVNAKIAELQSYLTANSDLSQETQDATNAEITRLQQSLIDLQSKPVEYTLEITPRYTLNMIISEKQDAIKQLQDILVNFAGFLVFTNNCLGLRIEKATASSYDFDDSNIVADSVIFNGIPSENRPNQYVLGLFDPANNWTQVKTLVDDTVDQKSRGKIVKKELTLTGCTSQSQVLRLGRLFRDIAKLCPVTINFSTTTFAMHLEPGDVVTISQTVVINGERKMLLDKIPVRILEISKKNGTWDIKAQQYNDTIYNDTLGAEIHVKSYVPIENPLSSTMTPPSSLALNEYGWMDKAGTHVSNIDVTWDAVDSVFFRNYIVSYCDGVTWNSLPTLGTSFRIPNVIPQKYYVKVQWQNSVGRVSDAVSSEITVVGNDNPPQPVTGFNAVQTGDNISFTWNASTEPDIKLYEIRMGSSWESSQLVAQTITMPYLWTAENNGTLNFWIKAVDNFGNPSAIPTGKSVNVFGIKPRNVILSFNDTLATAEVQGMYKDIAGGLNVQTVETMGGNAFFGDMFDSTVTYVSNASIELAPIDLGYGIIDTEDYYADPWGDLNIASQETIGSNVAFGDMFSSTVTPVNAKAIAETYVTVNPKYNPRIDNGIGVEYSVSLDNNSYSSKIQSLQKQFTGRYLRVSLRPTGGSLDLRSVNVSVDVPDVEFTIENIDISVTKTHIAFPRKLLTTPSVALFVCDSEGQMAIWKTSNVTNNGFDIELFSLQGNAIAGKVIKGIIRGY